MSLPTLTPASQVSAVILPATGSTTDVNDGCSFGVYSDPSSPLYSTAFLTGAADQVKYTYRKLAGDIVDIELTDDNVYSAFEEATLEYSAIINSHQAKNILYSALGSTTGSFDHDGLLTSGALSSSLSGSHVALKYPKFKLTYERRVAKEFSHHARLNGYQNIYSGSFDVVSGQQDYDLQSIISASAAAGGKEYSSDVGNKRINIVKVYYKTPAAMWRFFGYYGGVNVLGNLSTYGQFSDSTVFEVVPVWQNRLQAKAYEEAIYVRGSHFSYELRNNKLRIFPKPDIWAGSPEKMWFEFTVDEDTPWEEDEAKTHGVDGVNNMNTLPLSHLPFDSINSIGKMWIKRFALALAKEMLAHARGKFDRIPIPNNDVTLNSAELYSQAKEEQKTLRDDLKALLDELLYKKLAEQEKENVENVHSTLGKIPLPMYFG